MALGPIDIRVPVALPQEGRSAGQAVRAQASQTAAASVAVPSATATTPAAQSSSSAAQRHEVESAVKKANDFVQASAREITFSVDDSTGDTVVKVVDQATHQVIRQIPSKEMLEIAQALDHLQGLLVKQKA
jgi:flagellar protein FlaG